METTINDKTFQIRPLTRGEVKALRKKGYNLANLNTDNADSCMDEVNELVLGDRTAEIDAMPNTCAIDLFKAIIDETYGGKAEKNSLSSGDGSTLQTGTEDRNRNS